MKELTLYFEYCDWIGVDLKEYLLSLDGIVEVRIDIEESYVYVKYDNKKIKATVIKYEILFCVGGLRFPLIIAFDKHEKNTKLYQITIADICCEFCFKGIIEDLFMAKGINSAKSDFDYNKMFNVNIDITYDNKAISISQIQEIVKKSNS